MVAAAEHPCLRCLPGRTAVLSERLRRGRCDKYAAAQLAGSLPGASVPSWQPWLQPEPERCEPGLRCGRSGWPACMPVSMTQMRACMGVGTRPQRPPQKASVSARGAVHRRALQEQQARQGRCPAFMQVDTATGTAPGAVPWRSLDGATLAPRWRPAGAPLAPRWRPPPHRAAAHAVGPGVGGIHLQQVPHGRPLGIVGGERDAGSPL